MYIQHLMLVFTVKYYIEILLLVLYICVYSFLRVIE